MECAPVGKCRALRRDADRRGDALGRHASQLDFVIPQHISLVPAMVLDDATRAQTRPSLSSNAIDAALDVARPLRGLPGGGCSLFGMDRRISTRAQPIRVLGSENVLAVVAFPLLQRIALTCDSLRIDSHGWPDAGVAGENRPPANGSRPA